jgi:hypothetical protein
VIEAERWKFYAAVRSASQGHHKPLADLLEMLRDGHPRTTEDDRALEDFIRQLRTKPVGTPGRKKSPRPFGHTWNLRAAIDQAMALQARYAKRGIELTREDAAVWVAWPVVVWSSYRDALKAVRKKARKAAIKAGQDPAAAEAKAVEEEEQRLSTQPTGPMAEHADTLVRQMLTDWDRHKKRT